MKFLLSPNFVPTQCNKFLIRLKGIMYVFQFALSTQKHVS